MNEIEKFALELHNRFNPPWKLSESIKYVWKFKLNCFSETDIIEWFNEMKQQDKQTKDIDITVKSLPDKFVRDDWR